MHVHCQVWDQVFIDRYTDTEKAQVGSSFFFFEKLSRVRPFCGKAAIIWEGESYISTFV